MTNQNNNQSIILSTDVIQLTLALKITTAQVVETSVTVNNSPIQDYVHPDDQTQPTFERTPGFKPFSDSHYHLNIFSFSISSKEGEFSSILLWLVFTNDRVKVVIRSVVLNDPVKRAF